MKGVAVCDLLYNYYKFLRLLQRLCKPPNGCVIKIQVWRFDYVKEKKKLGGGRTESESMRADVGIGYQRFI